MEKCDLFSSACRLSSCQVLAATLHSLHWKAAVVVDSLCIIKLNNMGVQYTISQYLSAVINVDVKTIVKVQNPTKNKLFMV